MYSFIFNFARAISLVWNSTISVCPYPLGQDIRGNESIDTSRAEKKKTKKKTKKLMEILKSGKAIVSLLH